MSYQVLARKWRPKIFADMVGQEHVLRALINALDQQRLHQAYLFTGTRGVGKTTIARILAKALNCEAGVSSVPCGVCSACREIDEGRFIDLIEIDAASRTKVEDTREILDNVQYSPTRGRYKVYLIDEVHMLSTHSFNALLKTLEEPPPHVKFLLATTDPQNLPATILSRCLQFSLKRMPIEQIVQQLNKILGHENIQCETAAAHYIAKAADGSMRDALSLLDQAIAYGQGAVTADDVIAMLGLVARDHVYGLLDSLVAANASDLLARVAKLNENAPDYAVVLDELALVLQQVAIAQFAPDAIDPEMVDETRVRALAANLSKEDVQLYYQIALMGKRDLNLSADFRRGFEMTLLRMLAFRPADAELVVKKKLTETTVREIPKPLPLAATPTSTPVIAVPIAPPIINAAPVINPIAMSEPEPPLPAIEWTQLAPLLGLRGFLSELALNSQLQEQKNDIWLLALSPAYAQLNTKENIEKLAHSVSQYLARAIKLNVVLAKPTEETPAMAAQRSIDARQQQAVEQLSNDPVVQGLQEKFGARLQVDSVKPLDS
ncbi:MAG: DNA polymerase III subunit gamma/tau [Gammaproteobacteria bacterium]|nr:DNA polymerase III subunit gamma/tau [Gammaproteobacteria bacterium]